MTRKTLIALAVLTAFSTGAAFAAAQAPDAQVQGTQAQASEAGKAKAPGVRADGRKARPRLDANGDGFIDRTEAAKSPRLAEKFDQLDADKDGRLGPGEFKREGRRGWHGQHGDRRFAMARKHGGEARKLDTDGDGRISRAEAAAQPRFAERFDRMDANQDGFVDAADRQARAQQHRDAWFAEADTNQDGQLSRAEYDAAHLKMREKMQEKMQARRAEGAGKRR